MEKTNTKLILAKKALRRNAKHDPSLSKSPLKIGTKGWVGRFPAANNRPSRSKSHLTISDKISAGSILSASGSRLRLLAGPHASSRVSLSNPLDA